MKSTRKRTKPTKQLVQSKEESKPFFKKEGQTTDGANASNNVQTKPFLTPRPKDKKDVQNKNITKIEGLIQREIGLGGEKGNTKHTVAEVKEMIKGRFPGEEDKLDAILQRFDQENEFFSSEYALIESIRKGMDHGIEVAIGALKVSEDNAPIWTSGLANCIAIVKHDPATKKTAFYHFNTQSSFNIEKKPWKTKKADFDAIKAEMNALVAGGTFHISFGSFGPRIAEVATDYVPTLEAVFEPSTFLKGGKSEAHWKDGKLSTN